MSDIAGKISGLQRQIHEFERKYARDAGSVQLIAVSKTHPASLIRDAHQSGQKDFGENYLAEALKKQEALQDLPLCWHFIGPIQSNKSRDIATHFDWVHSVDRLKIARRLNDQRPAEKGPLNILLQVNISDEASKSGVPLDELEALARAISPLPNLLLKGLMTIPAPTTDFGAQGAAFRQLAQARDQLLAQGHESCTELSMGMSQDFEAAIAEGATMIRIGTDIFGPRLPQQQ